MQLPILYINLASRTDRREFMERQFAELGLTAERLEALTPDQVPERLIAYHRQEAPRRRCSASELACGLSHAAAWRLMVDRGYERAIILEDDVLLSPTFIPFTKPDILGRLGADMVKLETFGDKVLLGSTAATVGNIQLRELASAQLGCAAYLISREAAMASLNHPLVHSIPVDHFLFAPLGPHLLRSRILQATPSPAIQLHKHGSTSGLERSDLTEGRRERRRRYGPQERGPLLAKLAVNVTYAMRRLRLLLRDPASVFVPWTRVPFSGE